jgi:hypothetical protein
MPTGQTATEIRQDPAQRRREAIATSRTAFRCEPSLHGSIKAISAIRPCLVVVSTEADSHGKLFSTHECAGDPKRVATYDICDFCESKAAAPREAKREARRRRLPHHGLRAYDCPIAGHPGNVG